MGKKDILREKTEHESFGMLGFCRTSHSSPIPLFGSSVKHSDTITMVLKTGKHYRNLNEDWYMGGSQLFKVEMSAAQFADLITSMNQGDGVPVTIRKMRTGNLVTCEDTPYVDRGEVHRKEFKEHLDDVYEESKKLIDVLTDKFNSKKTFTKADKEEILCMCRTISQNIGCNMEFQVSQFDEQMEKSKTEAKAEIEAFFQNKMLQVAQQALVEDPNKLLESTKSPVILINEKEEKK